jgi:hypothetical protein
MFHPLIPDLVDPMLLAEANLPSLHQAVGLKSGSVTLTVDPTIRKPIRIKPDSFAAYNETGQRDVEDLILTLNACFAPFSIAFMKANIRPDESIWPIDLMTCTSSLQLMYLRAQHCNELIGHVVMLELSASLSPDGKIRPSVIDGHACGCRLGASGPGQDFNRNAALGVAVREFRCPAGRATTCCLSPARPPASSRPRRPASPSAASPSRPTKYMVKLPEHLARWDDTLRFDYESTGDETYFRDTRDPKPRSRRVFAFHQPETLHAWLKEPDTLRARLDDAAAR